MIRPPIYGLMAEFDAVTELVLAEPDPHMARRLRERVEREPPRMPVEVIDGPAEDLPFDDSSFETIVSTLVLCTVDDPSKAIAEARRILQPGGALIFVEHGRAPEVGIRRWQDRLTPLWRRLAGGCHLNRPIERLIAQAGFTMADLETGYLIRGPRVATYHYLGRALA